MQVFLCRHLHPAGRWVLEITANVPFVLPDAGGGGGGGGGGAGGGEAMGKLGPSYRLTLFRGGGGAFGWLIMLGWFLLCFSFVCVCVCVRAHAFEMHLIFCS